MIYTVTLNPSLDYVIGASDFVDGKINRCRFESLLPGGKGVNVSVVLDRLGEKNKALGFIAGYTGDIFEKMLNDLNISSDFIRLKDGYTRINVKVRDKAETDFNADGPNTDARSADILLKKLRRLRSGDFLVLSGSVPPSLPENIYEIAAESLRSSGIRVIIDASAKNLLPSLHCKPFLIKPNAEELGEIFSADIGNPEQAVRYAKELRSAGAVNVMVSLGSFGAVLVDEYNEVHIKRAVSVKPVNTSGAGDSSVAGFISGFIKKKDYDFALRLAVAAGTASVCTYGLAGKSDIYRFLREE